MNDRKKKLMIIVALIAVVGVSIGFASFSSSLLIKSSLSVDPNSSDFRVVFSTSDSEEITDDVVPTKNPTTITATNATIDNSVTPTIENLSATFISPGDSVVYNLYAYNAGKYLAYLNSVTLKGNKSCTPGEGTSIQLAGQACEAISITVKVGNDSYNKTTTGITGKSIGVGKSTPIEITLSYESTGARADGPFEVEFSDISLYYATVTGQDEVYEGQSQILYTGEIYRNSSEIFLMDNHQ
ncbi:MAG: hypothetical protein IJY25_01730 [Bacilli bacterium]|nr:hypothetical protein [Bacilli bacterium]